MKFRGLLVAAAVLAVLGGAIWWSSRTKEADATKTSADSSSPKILSIPQDQIKRIEIKKAAGDTLALDQPAPGNWQMTAPKPLPVDKDAVSSLAGTFSNLTADRLVEEKAADLGSYGLASPSINVTVTQKDGKTQNLLIGDETPTSGAFFAKLQNDPRVFTIASYNKTSIDKTPNDLRDKRLLTFDSEKLARVELAAKSQPVEFAKNNQNDWQILKPRPLRADGGHVEELIRKLKDARMETASDEDAKKTASAFASAAPVATVKVTDANGTQELQVRKDKKESNYYAKSSVVEGVHKIGSDLGDALNKGLDDFRNKKLFDFGWSDPSKVEYHEGAKQAVYTKSGDKWMSGAKQMDSTGVQGLIDKLRDLSASKFVEKGFTAPAIEVTVVSNDGKKTDKVALAKQGDTWLARRENEPTIYDLDSSAVEALQKAASEVKEAAPQQAKKK